VTMHGLERNARERRGEERRPCTVELKGAGLLFLSFLFSFSLSLSVGGQTARADLLVTRRKIGRVGWKGARREREREREKKKKKKKRERTVSLSAPDEKVSVVGRPISQPASM